MKPNRIKRNLKTEWSIKYVNSIFRNHIFMIKIIFRKRYMIFFFLSETFVFASFLYGTVYT